MRYPQLRAVVGVIALAAALIAPAVISARQPEITAFKPLLQTLLFWSDGHHENSSGKSKDSSSDDRSRHGRPQKLFTIPGGNPH